MSRKKKDNRPVTAAAVAVADSLWSQPERWTADVEYLHHDTGITIDMDGYIVKPYLMDEPDANSELVSKAIDTWVAKMMSLPKPEEW